MEALKSFKNKSSTRVRVPFYITPKNNRERFEAYYCLKNVQLLLEETAGNDFVLIMPSSQADDAKEIYKDIYNFGF